MDPADIYAANAAAMWSSLAQPINTPDGILGFATPGGARYLVRHGLASADIAKLVETLTSGQYAVVEDPYGVPPLAVNAATTVLQMPVMNRSPNAVRPVNWSGVTVTTVTDADTLAVAERVIVDGFPRREFQPWTPGQALPPRVLELPGWQVWLAHRGGVPAAAGYTFDDGSAVGVYWLATLPEHRSTGLGRDLMMAMLAGHPDRVTTLVATEAGLPLYVSLGFIAVSTAIWYVRSA